MTTKPQFRLRKLLWAIAILAIGFGIGRYPYFYIQSNARFQSRSQQATALISSYRSNRPPEIANLDWQTAIDVVQDAWAKTIAGREYIADDELEDILSRMRARWPVRPYQSRG